ncbi:dTDP-4-dehydrorhamnose 3,5-epimerase [Methyloferula stellata]|uniref:dTDP-4-dehydrorhamnose 3,5-epimerase n=1 Tax=Methyloferula stellata TaxID=876270 RepID=UPI000370CA2F|nr:dTDP-4-dehydrorhamnose 3,5-epimerase [Methyloferula stellata]
METKSFSIPGPVLLHPRKFEDARGFMSEAYNQRAFETILGDVRFVQDNHSLSRSAGTIRGMHFQAPPTAQGKLVRVVRGSIFDVAIDLRRGTPSFGQFVSVTLSAANWAQFWIPIGFAHGFCTLEPDTEVIYKVTDYYSQADDRGLAFDDPALAIPWPVDPAQAVLSDKDKVHPRLADLPVYFK